MKPREIWALTLYLFVAPIAHADEASPVKWGGYIDAYYAYDRNRPRDRDRSYTTQPARHQEFNINLAFVEASVDRPKTRGRLALQAGTSVESNYAPEPGDLSRHIQEAFAGYRLGEKTWIDGGILLSHIGAESFISRDNLLYTRSLVADYSPYYQSGLRLSHAFSDQWSTQLLVLNGWQNISETNDHKSFGTQLAYATSPKVDLIYNTYAGQEAQFRHFHDLVLKWRPSERWQVLGQFDLGFQGGNDWYGFSAMAQYALSSRFALNGRLEKFSDPENTLVATPSAEPFRTTSASFGIDTRLDEKFLWRNEVRVYHASSAVFSGREGALTADALAVSAITASF